MSESSRSPDQDDQGEECESASSSTIPVSSKRRSSVYQYFNEDGNKFFCKTCRQAVPKEKRGSTGNLHKHLEKHPAVIQKLTEVAKPTNTIQNAFKNAPYSGAKFENLILEYVILADEPFHIVEDQSFLKMLLHGRPNAPKIIKADALKNRMNTRFLTEREELASELKNIPGRISLIVDGWRSANRHSFHGIIGPLISNDWTFRQTVLDFDVLHGEHTGEALALSINKILNDFHISSKLLAVTSDNAANMCVMMRKLEGLIDAENSRFDSLDYHVRCLAHIINLACQSSLKVLKSLSSEDSQENEDCDEEECQVDLTKLSLLNRIQKTMQKLRKSDSLMDQLKQLCATFHIDFLEPMLDMHIRWNSTYEMLKRAVYLKKPIDSLMRNAPELERFLLRDEEWSLIEEIVVFLEKFASMTKQISVQATPTLSLSAVVYVELFRHIRSYKEPANKASDIIKEAAAAAESKLDDYYPKSDAAVHVVGLVLDPRCKLQWYKSVGYGHLVGAYKKIVSDIWKRHYKSKQSATDRESPEPENLFDAQMKRARFDTKDKLEKYLSENPVKTSSLNSGILGWWKDHESIFPYLSKMARDYLAVSGTGVPIEATFSMGTDLLTSKRRKMAADTVRMRLCLKAWLKFKTQEEFEKHRLNMLAEKMSGGD